MMSLSKYRQPIAQRVSRRHAILHTLASVLILMAVSVAANAQSHVNRNIDATPVFVRSVALQPFSVYTWTTSAASSGADPVMHLWDPDPSGIGVTPPIELAFDDDSGDDLNASITFTSLYLIAKTVRLIVRAYTTQTQGSATLTTTVNGQSSSQVITVGGAKVAVPGGPGYVYETAFAPAGLRDPRIFALDSAGHLLDMDDDSGVGRGSRIVAPPNVHSIVVGAFGNASGPVHLYADDPVDVDLDGLGNLLEAELGTCAAAPAVGGTACAGVFNPQDTDRDGLSDMAEVFGIDDPDQPQLLSRWGADPLHKDIFIEIDYFDSLSAAPFSEADALVAQSLFDSGPADHLGNPDGNPGVNLHFDLGFNPDDTDQATRYGDWGGSNAVPQGISRSVGAAVYRTAVRNGVFHYGLAKDGGGGQGDEPGQAFEWGGSASNGKPRLLVHELGHNLNLGHGGHSAWSNVNCKPNYRSVMNYAFQYQTGATFSTGENSVVLNPSLVAETAGLGPGQDASYLNDADFYRSVTADGAWIDWDYSGDYLRPIRAPVTFNTNGTGCSALGQNLYSLDKIRPVVSTPALVRAFGNKLFAFYADAQGQLWYRWSATAGLGPHGSCPGGNELGAVCSDWSKVRRIATDEPVRSVAAAVWRGSLVLAYQVAGSNGVRVLVAGSETNNGQPAWQGERNVIGARSIREPHLVPMWVDPLGFGGYQAVLALFLLNDEQRYEWFTMTAPGGGFTPRGLAEVRDAKGDLLLGTQSPTLATWPPFEAGTPENGKVCGAFTNGASEVGFYCYDRDSGEFVELDSAFRNKPVITAKPGLAFHVLRMADGTMQRDPLFGQFWMTLVEESDTDVATMWIASTLDGLITSDTIAFATTRRGYVGNIWSKMPHGLGMALYEDQNLAALKALYVSTTPQNPGLNFLPLADGSFKTDLRDGSDFKIMARGICLGLRGELFCGPASSSPWGY